MIKLPLLSLWSGLRRRLFWPSWKSIGLFFAWILVLGSIMFFSAFIYLERTLPDPESIAARRITESTKIYDRTGEVLLYDIHGEEKRTVIPWDQIPVSVKNATLASEDSGFYSHGGFDVRGIARAFFKDIAELNLAQGGSTITQQLIKNALLGKEKTPTRKLKELVLSIEVERRFSKDEIFWMYLNEIPYGSNAYGVQAAAKTFFGKDAKDLTLNESAILTALIKAPSRYSPYGGRVPELMARKDAILDRMLDLEFISEEEHRDAKAETVAFKKSTESITAPHFVIMVKNYLEEQYGADAVENGGFTVITTLDVGLQKDAEETVSKYAAINKQRYQASNASLVSINPKTGDVWALVGSSDYFDTANQGNFNVAVDGPGRQPGSAFKPFAYALAFEKGYPDSTILWDLKTEFNPYCSPDSSQSRDRYGLQCYHPQNYDGRVRGPVTLRQALAQSLNIPSVKTLYLAGISDTIALAQRMGISTLTDPDRYGLSLVLGGAEVHPIDLASAYGVFANDGVYNPWRIVLAVKDGNGNVMEQAEDESKRVLSTDVSRLIASVLSDNAARAGTFGFNSPLYIPGWEVAAKTGTTQDNRDAWVAGFTPSITTVVWTGNNNNSPMTRQGAGISASGPLWSEFMRKALAKVPNESFARPGPMSASKVMLDGTLGPQPHEILYYVDRSDPLGPYPANPGEDPLFNHWEWSVMAAVSVPEPQPEPGQSPQPIGPEPTPTPLQPEATE